MPQAVVNYVCESAVINAPLWKVWAEIFKMDFSWWSLISKVEGNGHEVGGTLTFHFKDGVTSVYRVSELSIENKRIILELVTSDPVLPGFSGAMHTIQLFEVTASAQTYIRWSSDFSADVTQEVVQDSKHKKLESFADLAKKFTH